MVSSFSFTSYIASACHFYYSTFQRAGIELFVLDFGLSSVAVGACGAPLGNDPAVLPPQGGVGPGGHQGVVGHHDNSMAALVEPLEQPQYDFLVFLVQVPRGLIGQDKPG